jgi:hypothetical protein
VTDTGQSETRHDARWHLAEAERLLDEARKADDETMAQMTSDGTSPHSARPWSFCERARGHVALAAGITGTDLAGLTMAAMTEGLAALRTDAIATAAQASATTGTLSRGDDD